MCGKCVLGGLFYRQLDEKERRNRWCCANESVGVGGKGTDVTLYEEINSKHLKKKNSGRGGGRRNLHRCIWSSREDLRALLGVRMQVAVFWSITWLQWGTQILMVYLFPVLQSQRPWLQVKDRCSSWNLCLLSPVRPVLKTEFIFTSCSLQTLLCSCATPVEFHPTSSSFLVICKGVHIWNDAQVTSGPHRVNQNTEVISWMSSFWCNLIAKNYLMDFFKIWV